MVGDLHSPARDSTVDRWRRHNAVTMSPTAESQTHRPFQDFDADVRLPRPAARGLRWLTVLVFLCLVPIYLAGLRVPAVGLYHDDGVYLVTAKALAEGHGYRIISLPDEPRQTKYPPVFPSLLALTWRMAPAFPANVWLLKLTPLIASLAWFLLTWRLYGALGMPASLRPLAVACTVAAPWTVYLSVTLLSETTFAALCTATLLVLEGQTERRPSAARIAAAASLAAAAVLTRTAGVALVAAVFGWLLLARRDPGRALLFGGVVSAWVAPWAVWIASAPDAGFYGVSNYASWNILTSSLTVTRAMQVRVGLSNLLWSLSAPSYVFGVPASAFTMGVTIAMLAAGVLASGVRHRVSLWFLVCYVMLILGWAWPPHRFIVVVAPLGLWIALAGVPATRLARTFAAIVLACTAGAGVIRAGTMVTTGISRGALSTTDENDSWPDMLAAATWISTHTRPDERLVGNMDPVYYLLTGRKATRGLEPDPFKLFYDSRAGNPFGTVEHSADTLSRLAPAIVVDSPDVLFGERPHLDARYDELSARGTLAPIAALDGFRFYRIAPQP